MALIYKQFGGAWIGPALLGSFNLSWPFAFLELHDEKVILKGFLMKTIEMPLEEIDSVRKIFCPRLLTWGIKINHHGKAPSFLVFCYYWYYFMSARKILSFFRQKGIPIERS